MISVYRRPVPKRARITPLHRRSGTRRHCSVCLPTPTQQVEQEAQSQSHQLVTSLLRKDPNQLSPVSLLPNQEQFFGYYAQEVDRPSSHISPPAALCTSRAALFLHSAAPGGHCIPDLRFVVLMPPWPTQTLLLSRSSSTPSLYQHCVLSGSGSYCCPTSPGCRPAAKPPLSHLPGKREWSPMGLGTADYKASFSLRTRTPRSLTALPQSMGQKHLWSHLPY